MRSAPRGPTGDRRGRAGSRGPTSHAVHTAASLLSPGRGRPRAPPTAPQSVSSCTRPAPSGASRSQAGPPNTILLVAQTQVTRKPKGPPGGSLSSVFPELWTWRPGFPELCDAPPSHSRAGAFVSAVPHPRVAAADAPKPGCPGAGCTCRLVPCTGFARLNPARSCLCPPLEAPCGPLSCVARVQVGESAGYGSPPLPKSESESFQWDFNKNEADAG